MQYEKSLHATRISAPFLHMLQPTDPLLILETALLAGTQPLPIDKLQLLFDEPVETRQIQNWLEQLALHWRKRGLELVQVASGWRFQTKANFTNLLLRLEPETTAKYSRAVMEVLAVIAYKQPVTRGDIEDIRGVAVGGQLIRQLLDREWIEVVGYRDTVGRPALFGTTQRFLDDLELTSIANLPLVATSLSTMDANDDESVLVSK